MKEMNQMNNAQTTPIEWMDAVLYLMKRVLINITGAFAVVLGVIMLLVAVDSPLNGGFFPSLLMGVVSLVSAWWLFTRTKKGVSVKAETMR
jgi:uncharacterized membrane protein HdeD (DUF308 family)